MSKQQMIQTLKTWAAAPDQEGLHRTIINTYNTQTPLPRGYRMSYNDPWCAATVTAAAMMADCPGVVRECSCGEMMRAYQAQGRWVEADGYSPEPGDLVLYDWSDNGVGDCTGAPDHIGVVVSRQGVTMQVVEGNRGGRVQLVTLTVNARYIRGFARPHYEEAAKADDLDQVPDWARDTVRKLVKLGHLRGTGEGLELSTDMLRVLVILDRAKIFK